MSVPRKTKVMVTDKKSALSTYYANMWFLVKTKENIQLIMILAFFYMEHRLTQIILIHTDIEDFI